MKLKLFLFVVSLLLVTQLPALASCQHGEYISINQNRTMLTTIVQSGVTVPSGATVNVIGKKCDSGTWYSTIIYNFHNLYTRSSNHS